MSCRVHDVIRLEKLGVPTVNVGTEAFIDESEAQARALGMPAYDGVWLPHPVAVLTDADLEMLARKTVDALVEKLIRKA